MADLAAKSLNQQAAAHADATVDAPHSERKPYLFERFMPRKNMLVDAIDKRAVKIKKEGWGVIAILIHGVGASETTSLLLSFSISAMLFWYSNKDEMIEESWRAVSAFLFRYCVYESETGRALF